MPERKVKIPWEDLANILRRSDNMLPDEEIRDITLVKPKLVLIRLHKREKRYEPEG